MGAGGGHSMSAAFSHLKGLDYSVVQQCMHCGLCLPTCPTYDATKVERHGPRGRISLMRAIADGRLDVTQTFADEMYFCLGLPGVHDGVPGGGELRGAVRARAGRGRVERRAQVAEAQPDPRTSPSGGCSWTCATCGW